MTYIPSPFIRYGYSSGTRPPPLSPYSSLQVRHTYNLRTLLHPGLYCPDPIPSEGPGVGTPTRPSSVVRPLPILSLPPRYQFTTPLVLERQDHCHQDGPTVDLPEFKKFRSLTTTHIHVSSNRLLSREDLSSPFRRTSFTRKLTCNLPFLLICPFLLPLSVNRGSPRET